MILHLITTICYILRVLDASNQLTKFPKLLNCLSAFEAPLVSGSDPNSAETGGGN
jgi:hypothetical protein